MYIRNRNSYRTCLQWLSILRYEDKIEFKRFFAFVVLYFTAWLYHLGLSKIGNKWPFVFHVWQIFSKPKKHKTHEEFLRKNSWIACLSARNFDPACPQCYQSSQLRTFSTWALDDIFVYFILIKTNNYFCWLSPVWQPWKT